MTALTKAEMAEKLFDELGLNKREAKEVVELFLKKFARPLKAMNKLNCLALEILILEIRAKDQDAIQRPVKKYPLPLVGL